MRDTVDGKMMLDAVDDEKAYEGTMSTPPVRERSMVPMAVK